MSCSNHDEAALLPDDLRKRTAMLRATTVELATLRNSHDALLTQRDALEAREKVLREALAKFVAAAKSWHDVHHGSQTVQCDWLCECIPFGEAALAPGAPKP